MIKNIFYIFISLVLFSCYTSDDAPSSIIKKEAMENILWDMMRAQNLAGQNAIKDTTIDVAIETKLLAKKVFEIHHIDSAKYAKSYNWYVKHPVQLKVIIDSLLAKKQREAEIIRKIKEKN